MNLPADFRFSQASLGDFVQCRRRFLLRYLEKVTWPALETEPALENERRMKLGQEFHRLVRQHLVGVPAERLTPLVERDYDLSRWWANYLAAKPGKDAGRSYPEIGLVGPLAGYRLFARYDLITITLQKTVVIFDWKTSLKMPRREWLENHMQTRVYPFLLVLAGNHLNEGSPIQPERIEMVYWFGEFPDEPQHFPYNQGQFEADRAYLEGLVQEIAGRGAGDFPLTDNEERCLVCPYRSLCARGVSAGPTDASESFQDFTDASTLDFDFDQIAEIEF